MEIRVWDETRGWGTVIDREGSEVLVRWDADPWTPSWVEADRAG